jgi:hypothetical protein
MPASSKACAGRYDKAPSAPLSCFPKDVQAQVHTASEHGLALRVLQAV